MLIICFWPILVPIVILQIVAISQKKASQTQPAQGTTKFVSVEIQTDDSYDYNSQVHGMRTFAKNPTVEGQIKQHLAKLVAFYRQYGVASQEAGAPIEQFIKEIQPHASDNMCPYCGVVHPFKASRARKCPDCGKQMIVRKGIFLTEEHVAELDARVSQYYDQSSASEQLKRLVQSIQDDIKNYDYGRAYLYIAEAYQQCAIIHNKKYENGFSAWDLSWGVLNGEAMQMATAGASSPRDMVQNGYANLLYARGEHCMRQLRYTKTPASQNRVARVAIDMFYNYLIELATHQLESWERKRAIEMIALSRAYGQVSDEQLHNIESRLIERSSSKPPTTVRDAVVEEVNEYAFLETDRARMRMMIYQ